MWVALCFNTRSVFEPVTQRFTTKTLESLNPSLVHNLTANKGRLKALGSDKIRKKGESKILIFVTEKLGWQELFL